MLSRKSRCYNGGNQHRFTPRYTEKPNNNLDIKRTWGSVTSRDVRNLMYYKEYLFDICKWCGKKIVK